MIGFLRLAVFGFLALSVMYFLISLYSKSVERERLENLWADEVKTGYRDAYVREGLIAYQSSLRKRLLVLVFVVPVVVVTGLTYVINFM